MQKLYIFLIAIMAGLYSANAQGLEIGLPTSELPGDPGLSNVDENNFHVYPNPSAGAINIEMNRPVSSKVTVLILDYSGRAIAQQSFLPKEDGYPLPMNLSKHAPGTYIIRVVDEKRIQTAKLVISR